MAKKIIYGCEERGDADSPYLTRYTLIDRPNWQLCLHVFHRSDADDLHDHPWNFWTLFLWRGYAEKLKDGTYRRFHPGQVVYRKAEHAHRVVLYSGKPAVTLVLMGKRVRDWGFFTSKGWTQWMQYFIDKKC